MATVNNIRLLGEDFSESRIVEKVITTLLEKFKSKISLLEDSRDLSTISLSELANSLYALEQRRANREKPRRDVGKKRFPPCIHCKKTTHLEKYCWYRLDIQCKSCKQFGHIEKVCKSKGKAHVQHQIQAQAAEDLQAQKEHVFTALCFTTSNKVRCNCLVDSSCIHHMAADEKLFKDLDRSFALKIKIGNGNLIEARGKRNVVINTCLGNKVISDALFVLDINQNLLSVGQLIEKGYSLAFKNYSCVIEDSHS
ncbi:uncharacterized protein LOC108475568 [Gossypium arboreum]|uniref:uncharacterized protein LOC108475568 n=1 Tax=Gossypium arboreum TaxID=29729 RepID=UPI000818FF33|nr:uncharacterized protein LOC108475568 [Gossypium arboreum]